MILHALVVEDIAPNLRPPLNLLLPRLNLILLLHPMLQLPVVELRFEKAHRILAVVLLRAGLRILNENLLLLPRIGVGILITETNPRLHLIHILPAGTSRTEEVPRNEGGIHHNLYCVIYEGSDEDRGEGGHPLPLGVVRGDPHESMHPILAFEIAVGAIPLNLHCHCLYPRLITRLIVAHRHLITIRLRPAHIHSHQHFRPILTLRSSCTGVYLQHTIHRIRLIAEHILQLNPFEILENGVIGLIDLLFGGLPLLSKIEEHLEIFDTLSNGATPLNPGTELPHPLHHLLRLALLLPEGGVLRPHLQLLEFDSLLIDLQISIEILRATLQLLQLLRGNHKLIDLVLVQLLVQDIIPAILLHYTPDHAEILRH